jgi:hypothetical protein
MGHAQSYEDDGTPQEQSRRKFMVNMVVGLSGVIGLVLGIPLLSTMIPDSSSGGAAWSPLSDEEFKKLEAATEKPIKVTFNVHTVDGYLPPANDEQFVWAIKTSEAKMRAARPELFTGKYKLPYAIVNMGFVVFSSDAATPSTPTANSCATATGRGSMISACTTRAPRSAASTRFRCATTAVRPR